MEICVLRVNKWQIHIKAVALILVILVREKKNNIS